MASVITIIAEIQRVKLEYGVTLLIPTRDGNFVIHFLPRQAAQQDARIPDEKSVLRTTAARVLRDEWAN